MSATSVFGASQVCPIDPLAKEVLSVIKTISSIEELPVAHPQGTVLLTDLDDVAIHTAYDLGSRGWKNYIYKATDKCWPGILSIYLARILPHILVESKINEVVATLKENGHPTAGLTAKKRNQWYSTEHLNVDQITIAQLKRAGFKIDDGLINVYPGLNSAEYYGGVFFCPYDLKGDYLIDLLEKVSPSNRPKKVLFIDDRSGQVKSVAAALQKLGIDHECYHYKAVEEKEKRFSPVIANIQLLYLLMSEGKEIPSDEEAFIIAQKDTTRDETYYLNAALEKAEELEKAGKLNEKQELKEEKLPATSVRV